jgi:hypothetical protein
MDGCLGILRDVAVGLITGVIASATYETLAAKRQARELRATFGKLQGEYSEWLRKPGSKVSKTGGTVTLTYCGGRKFTSMATDSNGQQEWEGEFNIGEGSEVLGAGFYKYKNKDDNGIHRVIYISMLKQFDVSGENTSHPDGNKDFKMIWKLEA